jgi:hypothetical protein
VSSRISAAMSTLGCCCEIGIGTGAGICRAGASTSDGIGRRAMTAATSAAVDPTKNR